MKLNFNDKKIFITWWTWSWWSELTKQLLENYKPKEIIIYSRWEIAQVNMSRNFSKNKNLKFVIGDVRDLERLIETTKNVDYIFHLAALKHVPICEDNPWECIKTNINGTKNVIEAANKNNVWNVIYLSSDKACNPINLYWNSKSIWEKLIIDANFENKKTKFICIRIWNALWTNWSIVPFFIDILKNTSNSLPITDIRMTRYFLTVQEAIWLIFKAINLSKWWEIFVTKMPACSIIDLAEVLSKLYNKEFKYRIIWIRNWEKLHEELISENESKYTVEKDDFRIILPINWKLDKNYKNEIKMNDGKYTSNDILMSKNDIKNMLTNNWIIKN